MIGCYTGGSRNGLQKLRKRYTGYSKILPQVRYYGCIYTTGNRK